MRKYVFAALMAGTALIVSACSEPTDETVDPRLEGTMSDADSNDVTVDTEGSTVLDANSVTAEQLAVTGGISPELATAIIAGQPYASVTDFHAVLIETLTSEEVAAILAKVFVPVNLNAATSAEIELIPGMTDRMVHEFEEYRPYEDMAEFDREIGKYVDEEEVARLRNYVTL